uniref:Replication protein n=1 Tax=Cruciviridae sp. TaxID=1955495 RepID=A0A1S6LVI2_9VIRU|nr:replication protein [Cruciviridae sp.]
MSNNRTAVSTWDFTAFNTDVETCKKLLTENCKKWCFQEEQCPETKTNHFQGRFSLKVKARLTALIKIFVSWHLSITSKINKDNNFYVTKEDTRINGPWSSEDVNIYIPRQVREIVNLHPWQQQIVDNANVWDTRTINVILDTKGNNGKSTICAYIEAHGIGEVIEYTNDLKDIMRMVYDLPTSKLYLIDLPRCIDKSKMYGLYAGIECIKNGKAYDDRYHFKKNYSIVPISGVSLINSQISNIYL